MSRLRGEAHPRAKLTEEQVKQIRQLYAQGFSINAISKNFGVSKWNIQQIVTNKTWKHV